jgi:hypothetical protein
MEAELALRMELPQSFCKLAPEHFLEHIHRQEELSLRIDPARALTV